MSQPLQQCFYDALCLLSRGEAERTEVVVLHTDNHIAIKVGTAIVPLRCTPVGLEVGIAERIAVETAENSAW